jgi:hypothetical protein
VHVPLRVFPGPLHALLSRDDVGLVSDDDDGRRLAEDRLHLVVDLLPGCEVDDARRLLGQSLEGVVLPVALARTELALLERVGRVGRHREVVADDVARVALARRIELAEPRAHVAAPDVQVEPDLLQVLLEDLRHRDPLVTTTGERPERERRPRLDTCGVEQLLRLREVELVALEVLVIGVAGRADQVVAERRSREAEERSLHHRRAVGRVVQGLPCPDVAERSARRVDFPDVCAGDALRLEEVRARRLNSGNVGRPDLPDHVQVAALEVRNHRRRVRLAHELDLRDAGLAAEPMRARHEGDALVRDELGHRVRTGAVAALGEIRHVGGVAHLDVDERVRKQCARAAELDPDLVLRDHAHRTNVLHVRASLRRDRWIEDAQDVRACILCGERPPECVTGVLAEVEPPGLEVFRGPPRGREVRHDHHRAVVLRQGVVEQRLERRLPGEVDRIRVELRDARACDAVGQGATRLLARRERRRGLLDGRRGAGCRCDRHGRGGREQGEQHRDDEHFPLRGHACLLGGECGLTRLTGVGLRHPCRTSRSVHVPCHAFSLSMTVVAGG